jgi:hypothetical protein
MPWLVKGLPCNGRYFARNPLVRLQLGALIKVMKEITKCTAIFVQDDDGHWYCIHEDDRIEFSRLLNLSIKEDYDGPNFEEFDKKFGNNMIGMDPNMYREQYLK